MNKRKDLKEGMMVVGQIDFSNNGNAQVRTEEYGDIFVYRKNTYNSFHMDTVTIELVNRNRKLEGVVKSVDNRFKTEWVGKVQVGKNTIFVIPDNLKIPVDFYVIEDEMSKGLTNDQKVVVKLVDWKDSDKSPRVKVSKLLGNSGDNNVEMNSIMFEYGLPVEFPQEVELEANNIPTEIPEEEIRKRKDIRNTLTFTIDPVDSRDFDDALSFKYIEMEDLYEIGVHIADVTHYVKPGTAIYDEAINRSTSIYLVNRCIPMLPERLSNGICSLVPHEDRLAYSVIFKIRDNGDIVDTWYGRTVIHSDHRFTYEKAQSVIELDKVSKEDFGKYVVEECGLAMDFRTAGDIIHAVTKMNGIAKCLRKSRLKTGAIEMDSKEVRFKLDETGKPIDVYFKEQKDSNKLIEEFMLLANRSVAKLLHDSNYNCSYRIHDKPDTTKLESLRDVCANFGYQIDLTDKKSIRESLNKVLVDVSDKPEENMISSLVTRSMQKAQYSIKNIGHYGLGDSFDYYLHFTSPIRRISDTLNHAILTDCLNGVRQGSPNELERLCKRASEREVVAAKASRDSIKYKQAEYLQDKIGRIYEGMVSGVTHFGVYVQIPENGCEGLIRYDDLGGDNFIHEEENYRVVGQYTGEKISLGDKIMIMVSSIDLDRKNINFTRAFS